MDGHRTTLYHLCLCFVLMEQIPSAKYSYNVPGCFHGSIIAESGNICRKPQTVYESVGGKYTVNSAFRKKWYDILIKESQTDPESDDRK